MTMLDVFILAASPAMREGLRHLVESPDVRVLGDASLLPRETEAGEVDVFLLANGDALAEWPEGFHERQPAVVALADGDTDAARLVSHLRVLDLRGWAVVPSTADGEELRAALLAADAGLAVMPVASVPRPTSGQPGGARRDVGALRRLDHDGEERGEAAPEEGIGLEEPLTPREREVLELLGRGQSNREIAARLGISEHTAKFHVASILGKLGAANRADAVRRGLRRGLVTL